MDWLMDVYERYSGDYLEYLDTYIPEKPYDLQGYRAQDPPEQDIEIAAFEQELEHMVQAIQRKRRA